MKESKQFYSGISDIPCYNFDKVIATNDYTYLLKPGNTKKFKHDVLEKIWENIYDEFIKEFGLSEQYRLYLEEMGMYVQHLNAAYNEGNRAELTMAEIRKRKAEEIMQNNTNNSNLDLYAVLSKGMGFQCKAKELTVKEAYSYLKLLSQNKE